MRAALAAALLLALAPASATAGGGGTVACTHVHEDERPAFLSQAPVPADFAAQLGVLRRAPTAEETAAAPKFARLRFGRILYANSVRVLRTDPDGTKWYLFLGKGRVYRYPKRCLARLPLHQQHVLIREQQRAIERAKVPRMGLWQQGPGGISGGGFGPDIKALLTTPTGSSIGDEHHSTVYAVVPDGVATADLTFANGDTTTVTVTGNFWTTRIDGSPDDAVIRTMIWRAADGSVIKTLRGR